MYHHRGPIVRKATVRFGAATQLCYEFGHAVPERDGDICRGRRNNGLRGAGHENPRQPINVRARTRFG